MSTLCAVFYSIGRPGLVFRESAQAKCLERSGAGVVGREEVGVVPGKSCGFCVTGGMCPGKVQVNCACVVLKVLHVS